MNKRCLIFAAGDYCGVPDIHEGDFIIAADAGYLHAEKLGIKPNLAMGDFDSLQSIPKSCEIIKFKSEKDDTDTSLACAEAINRGYNDIIVCGALGGNRFEHTLANIQTAHNISSQGFDITLTDGTTFIKVITNTRIEFSLRNKGYISIFSLTDNSFGVDICGMKYTLNNACLSNKFPLGVSNEFTGQRDSYISVKNGTLAIIWKNS